MRNTTRLQVAATVAVLGLVSVACGGETASSTTVGVTVPPVTAPDTSPTPPLTTTTAAPAPTTTTAPPSTTQPPLEGHVLYFFLEELEAESGGPFLVPVYRQAEPGDDPATTALELLVSGPTADEVAGLPSIASAIPEGTEVIGVDIADGVATVSLSDEYDDGGGSFSMFGRLAQVVYTATRLPGVEEVVFVVAGEPVSIFSAEGIELHGPQGRPDYYDQLPPIFVDWPAWGEPVTSPVSVGGLSNVFEATSRVMITNDDGRPLDEAIVTATCGTGCWGEWETELSYEVDRDQFGALIVWEFSAEDGSRIHIREYPVHLR